MSYPYGNRPSSFSPGRLVIGAIIAVVALGSYFFHTSTNPVTGEKQHVTLSPQQETSLGLEAAPQMAREMGGEVDPVRSPAPRFVSEVGQQIAHGPEVSHGPYTYAYHLLRDTETVNAFALPGGQVFITRGLYDKLPDEAALAGVLGHETGHVVGRHSAEQMAQGKLGQELVLATGVAASGGNDNGQHAVMIAAMVNQMSQLKFSRHDESEADTFGLKYMADAGYDPRAMLDVMHVLADLSHGSRPPEFLQTHPYPQARLEAIETYLKSNPPAPGLSRGRSLPR